MLISPTPLLSHQIFQLNNKSDLRGENHENHHSLWRGFPPPLDFQPFFLWLHHAGMGERRMRIIFRKRCLKQYGGGAVVEGLLRSPLSQARGDDHCPLITAAVCSTFGGMVCVVFRMEQRRRVISPLTKAVSRLFDRSRCLILSVIIIWLNPPFDLRIVIIWTASVI